MDMKFGVVADPESPVDGDLLSSTDLWRGWVLERTGFEGSHW